MTPAADPGRPAPAGTTRSVLERAAMTALDAVRDPELDEPITDLGFVRSVSATEQGDVVVHLRLPTSFCAPNFAYLMASDAKDALSELSAELPVRSVVVRLDDHHDSDLINRGLALDAGYRGTFGSEAEDSLDELRHTFHRKAHTAAMERALTLILRSNPDLAQERLAEVTLGDLPAGRITQALRQRREALGLSTADDGLVLVDDQGRPCPPTAVALRLRMARSVRVSIDGNAHFCRGLLRTRYPDSAQNQAPSAHGDTDPDLVHPFPPLKAQAS